MESAFRSLAKFIVKWRWVVLLVWIVLAVVLIKTLPSLSNVTTNNNSAFLPASAPSQKAANLYKSVQGQNTSSSTYLVASSSSGPLTQADTQAISRLEAKIRALPNVNLVKEQALSSDGQVEEILIGSSASAFNNNGAVITDARAQFNKVQAPSNLSFHLTGALAESVDNNKANEKTRNATQTYIFLFIIVLLFLVYRSLLAPFITLIPAGLSLAIASPVIAESTKIGVQVSPITQLLLIVLLLGAGTDYGIFLVFRVREHLKRGHDIKEAVIEAMAHVGKVITFSALTVTMALISLLLASFGLYKGLGPGLAIGVGILLLSGLTLLPALIAIFGRASFWPSKPKPINVPKLGVWGQIAEKVIARPILTLMAGLLIIGALIVGLIGYKTGGFNNSAPPPKSDSAIGASILNSHFPAANNNPEILVLKFKTSVWNNIVLVNKAQTELASNSLFKSISGPINVNGTSLSASQIESMYKTLGPPQNLSQTPKSLSPGISLGDYEAYRSVSQFIDNSGTTVDFYSLLKAGSPGTTAAANAIPAVRAELTQVASSVGATASGVLSEDSYIYDIDHISTQDLYTVIPVVLVVIGILLALMLQSLIAPIYLILTVGLSYLASLGFANIVFVHFNPGSSGLVFFLPFLLFIFCMALGEDYNILVMSRIREEAHGSVSLKEAVHKAIGHTGTTVTSAGLILAGTFAILGLAGGESSTRQIGYIIAFGIMLDTFFVRTLLVPSIAVLLGRYNWWPSKLSKV